jgi:hypothetical protein
MCVIRSHKLGDLSQAGLGVCIDLGASPAGETGQDPSNQIVEAKLLSVGRALRGSFSVNETTGPNRGTSA